MAEFIPTAEPDWLPVNEVAKRLGIGRTTAWTMLKEGRFPLPTLRVGRKTVVSKVVYQRYLEGAA